MGLRTKVKLGLRKFNPAKRRPQYIFISHQLDQSGAPFVLLDIISDFVKAKGKEQIKVFATGCDETNSKYLAQLGVDLTIYPVETSSDWLAYQLNLNPNDFVLMNTTAIGWSLRDWLFSQLELGKLNRLGWYIHEGVPTISFTDRQLTARVKKLLTANLLKMYLPGQQAWQLHRDFFNSDNVLLQQFRFTLANKYKLNHQLPEYDNINFIVNGSVDSGRKGQPTILTAFSQFYQHYYQPQPDKYRNFKLSMIGLGEDFLSKQLISLGQQLLSKHFSYQLRLAREQVLETMTQAQANVTYSYMEALPINVFESMYMGHFLLRNACSGVDEQLRVGSNGYLLEQENLQQFVDTIEQVLNLTTTSNQTLLAMGQASQTMLAGFMDINYVESFLS